MNENNWEQVSLDKISVIAPVKNEEASIERLFQGIFEQTCKPSEIVIVDGGSTDKTKEMIGRLQVFSPIPIVLIETDHALPGRGRNLAIEHASNEWIACIDAGIIPRADWLAELVATARQSRAAQVIYGRFEPVANSYFTECAAITYVAPSPRTRSIASCLLGRAAWRAAGGFPEHLRSGEDLLFFRRLDAAGIEDAYSEQAVVAWELQPSISGTFRRFVTYSRSNLKAGLGREWQFNVIRFYAVLIVLLVAGLWYWPFFLLPPMLILMRAARRIWNWFKVKAPDRLWRELLNPRRVLTVAGINLLIDLAMFYGTWQWLLHDRSKEGHD
jgi:glycosyltransferase involved in cell wall biosynthesis